MIQQSALLRLALAGLVSIGILAGDVARAERYHYDDPGRLVRVVYDDLSSIAYTYDANGNLTAVTTTQPGLAGDVDLDGDVDQVDLDLLLARILAGGQPYSPTADCTLDDVVSVLDLICAVGAGAPGAGAPTLSGEGVKALPGDSVPVSFSLAGVAGVARAVQLDLMYDPAVASVNSVVGGDALASHILGSASLAAGVLRVVVYSPTNTALASGAVADVTFDVAGGAAFGPSALPFAGAIVGGPDATAMTPLTLDDSEIQVAEFEADLGITKSASAAVVADGDPLYFTVTVTNTGPAAVTDGRVVDLVPADLTAVTWDCTGSGGGVCDPDGFFDIDDLVDLPVGASVTYTVNSTVSSAALVLTNSATVEAPADTLDAVSANDSATVEVGICGGPPALVIGPQDVSSEERFSSSGTLTAQSGFRILASGDATLQACDSIVLESGVSVETGGQLVLGTRSP